MNNYNEVLQIARSSKEDLEYEQKFEKIKIDKYLAKLRNNEYASILKMRKFWSYSLLIVIIVIVIIDFIIIFLIGTDVLNFDNNKYIIPIYILESIVKIFGLAYLVVRFLFDKNNKVV